MLIACCVRSFSSEQSHIGSTAEQSQSFQCSGAYLYILTLCRGNNGLPGGRMGPFGESCYKLDLPCRGEVRQLFSNSYYFLFVFNFSYEHRGHGLDSRVFSLKRIQDDLSVSFFGGIDLSPQRSETNDLRCRRVIDFIINIKCFFLFILPEQVLGTIQISIVDKHPHVAFGLACGFCQHISSL